MHAEVLYRAASKLAHGLRWSSFAMGKVLTFDASIQIVITWVGAHTDAVDEQIANAQLWKGAQKLFADARIACNFHKEIARWYVST